MRSKLKDIICQVLTLPENSSIGPNQNLVALGLDSLRLMRLINNIEKYFNVVLDDSIILPENFATLTKIEGIIGNN